jgi:hypothetical protein
MVMRDGTPWWVLADVAPLLELSNPSKLANRLEDYQKADIPIRDTSSGQNRRMIVVNEAGIYALTLNSKKAGAKAFARWLFTEVLPSIRRYGTYPPPPALVQPENAHQPSLATTIPERFVMECQRIADEKGYASVDEFGLLFMTKGKWVAMKRGDGVVRNLLTDYDRLTALVAFGFDLRFILSGVYHYTPQERRITNQLRGEAAQRLIGG